MFSRFYSLFSSSGSIPRNQAELGHGPITVLEIARVRQNGESSLTNIVIRLRWGVVVVVVVVHVVNMKRLSTALFASLSFCTELPRP